MPDTEPETDRAALRHTREETLLQLIDVENSQAFDRLGEVFPHPGRLLSARASNGSRCVWKEAAPV